MKDIDSLAHTKWRCQYHIVFAPKYRRQIIYGKYKAAIGKILRRICERCEGVEIIEANACEDHIHMLVTIPPKLSVSKFMGILKGKSSLMIFDQFANLKYKYGNRHFWCRGYYVDTVTYFYGYYFQRRQNFALLPALLFFIASKSDLKIIFEPNSVNLRQVRVQTPNEITPDFLHSNSSMSPSEFALFRGRLW